MEKRDVVIIGGGASGVALAINLKKVNPNVDMNIFKSLENVNLDTVIAYRKNGEMHSFLDEYDK